jgi:hypothetical protein
MDELERIYQLQRENGRAMERATAAGGTDPETDKSTGQLAREMREYKRQFVGCTQTAIGILQMNQNRFVRDEL